MARDGDALLVYYGAADAFTAVAEFKSRYVGEAKTHFQHLVSAAAVNVVRISSWLMDKDRAGTRTSAYERLMTPPAPN